jgi:hypothetical protein
MFEDETGKQGQPLQMVVGVVVIYGAIVLHPQISSGLSVMTTQMIRSKINNYL